MKRLFALLLLLLTLTGCVAPSPTEERTPSETAAAPELRGIWISCYEMNFGCLPEADFRAKIGEMFDRAAGGGLNAVFVHLRANSDAFYPSARFPWAKQFTGKDGSTPAFDTLSAMIEEAHARGLAFHGWLNPYRITGSYSGVEALDDRQPAKRWLTDEDSANDGWAVEAAGGLYYNPGVGEVQRLILDGVREIAENYPLDGIHFDDYFYPTTDQAFDAAAYNAYLESAGKGAMPLDDWRRTNVNALVTGVYSICKSYGKLFGISPAAAISKNHSDRNYTELYADIPLWMSNEGYVDYIAPQLYFGFDYPYASFTYNRLVESWMSLPRLESVRLYVGLGTYKIGTQDAGSAEWMTADDILKRQVLLEREAGCDGFILYSYTAFTNTEPLFQTQMQNLQSVL